MKTQLFNNGWEFILDNDLDAYNRYGLYEVQRGLGAPEHRYPFNNWKKVCLPHDWAVGLPKDMRSNTYNASRATSHYNRFTTEQSVIMDRVDSVGWYRKEFAYQPEWKGKRVFLEFEGIYRNATFWINGMYADTHFSGYTGYILELTDALFEDNINSVTVRVDVEQPEGYWYEGAGIYRNVNLLVAEEVYCKPYETVIKADTDGNVTASAILVNEGESKAVPVKWTVLDAERKAVAQVCQTLTLPAYNEIPVSAQMQVDAPKLWDLEAPNLYTLQIKALDTHEERFGFREFRFDGQEGFFLNGNPTKIKGACVHHDFAGIGIGLSENLIRYKLKKLKEMGFNAYRTHYAHAPALLRACDEMGILVMAENRMFGSFPEAVRQFTDQVRQCRNHPSIFIWSIGNEETYIQHSQMGKKMAEKIVRIVNDLDGTRLCTYAGNDGSAFDGINAGVPVKGINYIRNMDVDAYHAAHPEDPILGTEEGCYVLDRVSLSNDISNQSILSNGTVTMTWASTPKGWVKYVMERPWYSGAFLWCGFDFHGEPHPYVHSAFSTYMGAIDLCGIEKPVFYYYKAWFTNEPVLKITPHWNGRKGQKAIITVFTNCEYITLKCNGKIVGQQQVSTYDAPEFELNFEEGLLEAEGIRNGEMLRDSLATAGAPCQIVQELMLPCEGPGDIGIIELRAVDANGTVCADNHQRVALSLTGGDIVGVGNGNPMDDSYEQKPEENTYAYIRSFETQYGHYPIPPKQENGYMYSPFLADHKLTELTEPKQDGYEDDFRRLMRKAPTMMVHSARELCFVHRCQLSEDFAYLEFERLHGKATVYLDGVEIGTNMTSTSFNTRPFRFACKATAGFHEVKVITTLSDGILGGMSGYVRFGKEINRNKWTVSLYGGKARVLVKYQTNYALEAKFCKV